MKVLSGYHEPSDGQLIFDGEPIRFRSPRDARNVGVEMVYQDLAMAGNLSIAENIFLGREFRRKGLLGHYCVDHAAGRRNAARHLDDLHIHVQSVEQRVEDLSGGQRQAVAIARATAFEAKVVIMDEPTAALAIKEVGKVLDLIASLRARGISVVLISHRMDDIFYVCDRVLALFHGRNFAEADLHQTDRSEVIGWIMGTMDHKEVPAHDRI
jgi:simple sugar transport system ATP-binding protein